MGILGPDYTYNNEERISAAKEAAYEKRKEKIERVLDSGNPYIDSSYKKYVEPYVRTNINPKSKKRKPLPYANAKEQADSLED